MKLCAILYQWESSQYVFERSCGARPLADVEEALESESNGDIDIVLAPPV